MENLLLGFATATTAVNLAWCLLGVTLGTLVGVLPGLGAMAAISLLLPFTYSVSDPIGSLIFLAGIYYGSQYGGSIAAILLKLPGEVSSTVTALDGHAMAQAGRGGSALTITAVASFVGGTVATVAIAGMALPLSELAFVFGPAEYASLMLLGLLACVAVTQGPMWRGLAMIMLGAGLGMVGTDISTGATRFTGGIIYLTEGIPFAVLAIGLFGLGEMFYNLVRFGLHHQHADPVHSLYPTRQEAAESVMPVMRGTALGTLLGLLPGGGAVLSSFLSYATERRLSKQPERFGRGAVAGVAGPEAANNAGAQSSFLPTLMLGLPVTPIMALMIAVMIANGIQPGPNVISNNPALFWGLIVSMWIGNLILIVLNIPLVRIWIRVLHIPLWVLYPLILLISTLGAYSLNNSWFDLVLLFAFGALGMLLRWCRFEPAPLVLAFVVSPMLEEYFRRAMTISQNDYTMFWTRPVSAALLSVTVLIVLISVAVKYQRSRP
jgi:TctA family transporter